jgi:hypothetical protein
VLAHPSPAPLLAPALPAKLLLLLLLRLLAINT